MLSTAPRLLLAFLLALQLPSSPAISADGTNLGGGWTVKSNGQCYGKKNKEVSSLSCDEGLALKERVVGMESLVATLDERVKNLHVPTAPVQAHTVSLTGMTPKRTDGGTNCVQTLGGRASCGMGLIIDGVSALVCMPVHWTDEQLSTFAHAAIASLGQDVPIERIGDTNTDRTIVYGPQLFNSPEGIPAYWDVSSCEVTSPVLGEYAKCATNTTFSNCGNVPRRPQRFIAMYMHRENNPEN